MKKTTIYILLAFIAFSTSSCSKYLQSGNGGFSDVSLNRNSDEYTIKRLKQIELDGNAIFGIPGLLGAQNNKNKNKSGMMFRFNGIEIGRTPRIFPIISMLAFSYGYKTLIKTAGGEKIVNGKLLFSDPFAGNIYEQKVKNKIPNVVSYLLAIPIAGITNNFLWDGVAASGLTNQVYYKLVDENQDIDVFVNPKYKVDYHPGIFTQKAHVILNATGATLKMK
jgi:hypothetical protein